MNEGGAVGFSPPLHFSDDRMRGGARASRDPRSSAPHVVPATLRLVSSNLLVVDLGNTNIVIGVYRGNELASSWRLATARERTAELRNEEFAE